MHVELNDACLLMLYQWDLSEWKWRFAVKFDPELFQAHSREATEVTDSPPIWDGRRVLHNSETIRKERKKKKDPRLTLKTRRERSESTNRKCQTGVKMFSATELAPPLMSRKVLSWLKEFADDETWRTTRWGKSSDSWHGVEREVQPLHGTGICEYLQLGLFLCDFD